MGEHGMTPFQVVGLLLAASVAVGCLTPAQAPVSGGRDMETAKAGPPVPERAPSVRPAWAPLRLTTAADLDCVVRPTPPAPIAESFIYCGVPAQADRFDIEFADMRLQVCVGVDGIPTSATVLTDPGHGFAEEILKCVAQFRYRPGLNAEGVPVPSQSNVLKVRYTRDARRK